MRVSVINCTVLKVFAALLDNISFKSLFNYVMVPVKRFLEWVEKGTVFAAKKIMHEMKFKVRLGN